MQCKISFHFYFHFQHSFFKHRLRELAAADCPVSGTGVRSIGGPPLSGRPRGIGKGRRGRRNQVIIDFIFNIVKQALLSHFVFAHPEINLKSNQLVIKFKFVPITIHSNLHSFQFLSVSFATI